MRLFHKIFLCFAVIFGITFQVAGYLLINFAYGNAIEQEKRIAFQTFQYNKYILQSMLYSSPDFLFEEDVARSFTVPVAIYGTDGMCIFSGISTNQNQFDFDESEDDRISFQIFQNDEAGSIFVYDYIKQGEQEVYFITGTDISPTIHAHREMIAYFQKIYLVILCIGIPLIFLITGMLTHSIKRVGKAAKEIAEGRYTERITQYGKDEVGELAADFNLMAEKIEEKVLELSEAARQKEDFTANFAHELKTPLTSVIGYADMLYQKDIPREQVKEIAGYILNEGMRLEALSLKLMDLFVLDKQDFLLESISVQEMFENMKLGLEPVCDSQGVNLHTDIENGFIKADYDLFETMIVNLVDNAVKADCKDVWIIGRMEKEKYQICVRDNGKGIPTEELGRITEAFYMVDKSRARKQHGAGLGMALVSKIAAIHKTEMQIKSDGRTGTEIYFIFCEQEGEWNE